MKLTLLGELNTITEREYKIVNESMTQYEYLEDAEEAVKYFNHEMSKLFSEKDWIASAKIGNILGKVFMVEFADRNWDVTIMNSPVHMRFMMSFSDKRTGKELPEIDSFTLELLTWTHHLKNSGVKFRKITAKSPMKVAKKLVDWFNKNEKLIKQVSVG